MSTPDEQMVRPGRSNMLQRSIADRGLTGSDGSIAAASIPPTNGVDIRATRHRADAGRGSV
jgi:hypothetical protein